MLRLILSILFFLVGLLCVFPAPESHLWLLSVVTTEFPWIFMIAIFGLLAWGFKVKKYKRVGNIVCLVALACFMYPVVAAYTISAKIDQRFEAAFGQGSLDPAYKGNKPFRFFKMLSGPDKQLPFTTLTYISTSAGSLMLDYYRSATPGTRPCLIVIHGGSWCGGDSRQLPELNSYLAAVGYNVASINYRLAPQYKWPLQLDDVHAAFTYLRNHSGALGADTNNFALLGRSAGGQIALNAAYTLRERGLKGVIDLYGPSDMAWGYNHPANPLVLDTRKIMSDYLGGSAAQVPERYAASSALEIATEQSVPTLMIFGKNDPLVPYENGVKLSAKLNEKHVKNMLVLLPWATHGCDYTLHGPSGQISTYVIEQFLHAVTSGKGG